jgi:hypothetical protein
MNKKNINIDEDYIMEQNNRDFPDMEDEEDDYDMEYITKLTIKSTTLNDTLAPKQNKNKVIDIIPVNLININKNEHISRKFNPRFPPPDKYKKFKNENNIFKFNDVEFPTL